MHEAPALKRLLQSLLYVEKGVVVGQLGRMEIKPRIRFEGELIEGNVLGPAGHCLFAIAHGHFDRLTGQAEHEIDVDVAKAGPPGIFNGLESGARSVDPADGRQAGIVEALDTQGQSVDAGLEVSTEVVVLECARIGFQSDFHVFPALVPAPDMPKEPHERMTREQARGSAAEKYGFDETPGKRVEGGIEVADQRIHIPMLVNVPLRFVGIEIAVRAFPDTPRKMDVERDVVGAVR